MQYYQIESKLYDKSNKDNIPITKRYEIEVEDLQLKNIINTFFSDYKEGNNEFELELTCTNIEDKNNIYFFNFSLFDSSILECSLFVDTKFKSILSEVRLNV
jgi:hypothetical protein